VVFQTICWIFSGWMSRGRPDRGASLRTLYRIPPLEFRDELLGLIE